MLANWIHIVLVHLPVLATPYLAYLAIRNILNSGQEMDSQPWKVTYTGIIALTVLTSIAYFTGPEAADWTKTVLEDYPQDHVENHALWGRIAFVVQVLIGLLGIMCWASILQEEKPNAKIGVVMAILLVVNTLVIIYTAHLGGMIRRVDLMGI